MELPFYKFDGAGNDFVIVDNREGRYRLTEEQVAAICHRRFGVGADGLMTLDRVDKLKVDKLISFRNNVSTYQHINVSTVDFEMHYYNSDGRLGSMCGNGGRCIAAFAHMLGFGRRLRFLGYDGPHEAEIVMWDQGQRIGIVRLGMRSVATAEVQRTLDGWFLDTGSPHYVQRVSDLEHYDVVGEGRRLRHRTDLFPQGANIDFVEDLPDGRLMVRTYERGVEDETWACGTGVTACALVTGNRRLVTRGGDFKVDFEATGTAYENVWLTGSVSLNFTGTWTFSAQ